VPVSIWYDSILRDGALPVSALRIFIRLNIFSSDLNSFAFPSILGSPEYANSSFLPLSIIKILLSKLILLLFNSLARAAQ
jgi:hypothetical protein